MIKKILTLFSNNKRQTKKGTVKFFNRKKGYGFIESDNHERDLFVHVTNLRGQISKGDQVTFQVQAGTNGPEAKNVERIEN